MQKSKHQIKAVLVVEDDLYLSHLIAEELADLGYEAVSCVSVQEALVLAPKRDYALFLVDAMLPNSPSESGISDAETRAGFQAGVALLRRLRSQFPATPTVLITGYPNGTVQSWCNSSGVVYMVKPLDRFLLREVMVRLVGGSGTKKSPKCFIVHGHDQDTLSEFRNFLVDELKFSEPIILRDQPGRGRTIIENLESYSCVADFVFVLLTPDDVFWKAEDGEEKKVQARQNVIFELGFFYGLLGRLSGRVILLHKGPVDIPSDIKGIIYVDISEGIVSAEEKIKKELLLDGIITG